jgi:polysaccharide biosynthesis protein PslH
MRIGVVTSRLPLPMTRADQMTVAHWIAFLSARGHRIELFALTDGSPVPQAASEWLAKHCAAVHLFRRPRWRALLGAAAGWLRGRPFQVGYFDDRAQAKAVRRAAWDFDAVYVYYMRSAEAASRRLPVPTVFGMQLSQTLNIERMLKSFRPGWEWLLYRLEAPMVRRYEARVWQRFTRTVLIGPADLAAVQAACRAEGQPSINNAVLLPHGTDLGPPPSAPMDDGETVMFLGVLATNTNVDGVLWFVAEIWPLIRAKRPTARFRIAGRRPRKVIRDLHGQDGIEVLGELDDPRSHLAAATVCISPVRAAAGMQNKLLDYFRAGKAVVATSAANEGIGAPSARAISLADQPADFAAAVLRLMDHPGERASLGMAARSFVENGWSWEAWFLKLEQVIETAARYNRPLWRMSERNALQYPEAMPEPELSVAEPETPWQPRRR